MKPDEHAVLWASESGYPEIMKYILARLSSKNFDHPRVEHYYKTCIENPTDQWYRDPEKRAECIQLLQEYYDNRFVLR